MGAINYSTNKYKSLAPGPGTYEGTKCLADVQLSWSMGSKLETGGIMSGQKTKVVPGPGNYDPNSVHKYDGHTKFGKSARDGIYDERKAKFVPSPFQYK